MAVSQVGLRVGAELQLSRLLRSSAIDPARSQTLDMVARLIRVDDVDGLVAAFQSILNERQQDAILLLVAIEQSADVPHLVEARTGEGDRLRVLSHVPPTSVYPAGDVVTWAPDLE